MPIPTRNIVFFLSLFLSWQISAQYEHLELNPDIFTDTIQAVLFEDDEDVFFRNAYDCAFSQNNILYLSDRQKGLYRLDLSLPAEYKSRSAKVYPVKNRGAKAIVSMGDSVFVGTQEGLYLIDELRDTIVQLGMKDPNMPSRYERGAAVIQPFNDSLMLIGNTEGLYFFNYKKDKLHKSLMHQNPERDGNSSKYYTRDLCLDPNDKQLIWGVDRLGLFKLNLKTYKQTHIECSIQGDKEWPYHNMGKLLIKGDNIYIIHRRNKLLQYNKKNESWKLLGEFRTDPSWNIVDKPAILFNMHLFKNHIYISGRMYGPMAYDITNDRFKQIYITHSSLDSINPNWESKNVLMHRFFHGMYWSCFDNNGHLWAGDASVKILRTNTPLFKPKVKTNPKIKIKSLYTNGILASSSILSKLNENEIILDQEQRDLAFSFGLYNHYQDSLEYHYKIENQAWQKCLEKNLVQLNLPQGNSSLKLEVRKANTTLSSRQIELFVARYWYEKIWVWLLCALCIATIFYLIYQNKLLQIRKEESLKSDFNKRLAEIEMQSLRAQMNPHFLFNSLNSIKHYTLNRSKEEAADYLTTFSLLIRQVLQNSNEKVISLAQELEAIKLYVEVEQKRFENRFVFELNIDESLNENIIYIPPLLIQPYVENAIWHGLMHLESKGKLVINIKEIEEKLECEIIDNGIGRKQAAEIKRSNQKYKRKSLGTKITRSRLMWVTEIYGVEATEQIIDLENEFGETLGTKVMLSLPKIQTNILEKLRQE